MVSTVPFVEVFGLHSAALEPDYLERMNVWLLDLIQIRASGIREVERNGQRYAFKSDQELDATIRWLDSIIHLNESPRKPVREIRFHATKGL